MPGAKMQNQASAGAFTSETAGLSPDQTWLRDAWAKDVVWSTRVR